MVHRCCSCSHHWFHIPSENDSLLWAVRREYYHPIRVNFFFASWIALLFLAIGMPPSLAEDLHAALWYVLMTPFLILELKIYGQWMSGGQRRLSKVANPTNHLSIVGNFVGALLGASMGLKEGPIFFFAVGLAHYTVLFVTLYQRLPTNDNPQGAPSSFLSVCCSSKCCFYGMGKNSRFIWSWITDSLLHCPVPLFITGESLPLKLPWAFLSYVIFLSCTFS